jgi:hypothetical protein
MTKTQFLKAYILPYTKKHDKPHNRQLFNDTKDMMGKDGQLTNRQVSSWIYPQTKLFTN